MTLDPIGWLSRWIPEKAQYLFVQAFLLTVISAFLWRKFDVDPRFRTVIWYEEVTLFITFLVVVATRRMPVVRATGWINLALPCFSAWLPFIPAGGLDLLLRSVLPPERCPAAFCPESRLVLDQPWGGAAVQILLCAGTAGLWISLLSLRRSFSVSVEVRSLVQGGIYRWLRHPMYLFEIVSTAGFTLLRLSPVSVAALVLFTAAMIVRANAEERLLLAHVPEYAAYRSRTWALLPIWVK
ncbi:MAG: isoprenylcysteine carboxylmethyltransferase family protein [Planctomycetes bacterium]|nr:isoprenylcysteine carboxylmethyltransferase family protein [Planctomycetota bacterium]